MVVYTLKLMLIGHVGHVMFSENGSHGGTKLGGGERLLYVGLC